MFMNTPKSPGNCSAGERKVLLQFSCLGKKPLKQGERLSSRNKADEPTCSSVHQLLLCQPDHPPFYKFLHSFILQQQRATRLRRSGTCLLDLHCKPSRGPDSEIVREQERTSSIHQHTTPRLPRVEVTRLLLLEHDGNSITAITRFDLRPYPGSRDVIALLRE